MRTYRRIETAEPGFLEFLARHADRMDDQAPAAAWVCEEDRTISGTLLAYTLPHLRLSVILESPGFTVPLRLAETFEHWAASKNIKGYAMVVDQKDDKFCKILERRGGILIRQFDGVLEYTHEIGKRWDRADGLRRWNPADWRGLRVAVRDFLRADRANGGEIEPSRVNIEECVRQGVRAAQAGDPCLLIQERGKIVAFVAWAGMVSPFEITPTCAAFGLYVRPSHRKRGLVKQLHDEAVRVATARGYKRVVAATRTKRAHACHLASGFTTDGMTVHREL